MNQAERYAKASVQKVKEAFLTKKDSPTAVIGFDLLESLIEIAYLEGRRVGIAESSAIVKTAFDKFPRPMTAAELKGEARVGEFIGL